MKNELPNKKFVELFEKDDEVVAIILFGSLARNEKNRDIDLCLILDKKYKNIEMSRKRIKFSSVLSDKYDVQIFQQLPLYVRNRILKEGKVILCKNEDLLYKIAFSTIKEYEFYKKIYYNYINSLKLQ